MSVTGRQVVTENEHCLLWRRGLENHFELAIAELTRRQLMAAVDNTTKTGKRGASKDPRKAATSAKVASSTTVLAPIERPTKLVPKGRATTRISW
ncbi:hypothetical protein ACVWWI_006216 [Bradyrhizobium sp. USDA 3686]|uniref:hypothetical protein n=1 Tax=Bradyrhizobium canariense TaxID=255045 RepID=UPI0019592D4A|nr:hypothetical protein [Bradyrhizobium canariense]MBM7488233.1 hypothetical protein [Bradyrhizobium canariense]